ncbi:energy transducer TonB [Salinisphaera sp. P385]|uniref:Protein TonB n=1 Tax=Spectribacter acetivorans TaxID=3075603 RepID=A0ABU3BAJ1_9GAMM|nr:energy transducer TonB [Salinisphaera sp. P385]MDT0619173.1 energy transducer TonB [Salinisphaera sp. P385]
MNATHVRRHGIALSYMVAGSLSIFSLVVLMNEFSRAPDREERSTSAEFSVEKLEQPEPEQVVQKPKPPPERDPLDPPQNPLRGLDSSLPGLDLGIPSVDMDGVAGASDDLLGESRDVVMTGDTVDEAPRPIRQGAMNYPAEARAEGVEGYVLLSVLVDENGSVEQVKVLSAEPGGVFDQIAAQGIQQWRFTPAKYKGETVKTWVRQRISFDLS